MQSVGKVAWERHFSGMVDIQTVLKKDSPFYCIEGIKTDIVLEQNTPVLVLQQDEYNSKQQIRLDNGTEGFVSFNNIKKPGSIDMLKLKPQDFKSIREKEYTIDELFNLLIKDIDQRKDIPDDTKMYLKQLTGYHAKQKGYTKRTVQHSYDPTVKGIAEIKKDYGEILGALAIVQHGGILRKSSGITISKNSTILFPLRGNEPVVDYYITDPKHGKLSISAKSGTTTNTLKPGDILTLLKETKKDGKWKRSKEWQLLEQLQDNKVIVGPFQAMNILEPGLVSKEMLKEQDKWRASQMGDKKQYNRELWQNYIKYIPQLRRMRRIPTVGEIFYFTERYVIENSTRMKLNDIFQDATSGLVIYLRYNITPQNPEGVYEVVAADLSPHTKNVHLRTKNGKTRQQDKLGIQP